MKRLTIFVAGVALVVAGLVGFLRPASSEAAAGPCTVTGAGLDAEESDFLERLKQWRAANLGNPAPLETSGALNAAAAWFAQWQVDHGGPGGHSDSFGRNWAQRAADCGYDAYFSNGTGEGVYAVSASSPQSIGPAQAIAGITYAGSGVRI
ncbi:MAG: hypothetical protein ABIP13_05490, partial [Tepidiformaceae bacterium]